MCPARDICCRNADLCVPGTCVQCLDNSDCDEDACEICNLETNVCEAGCSGETPDCNGSGTCVCNATSCVGGCCNGSTCVPYAQQSDGTCGASGTCAPCDTNNCFTATPATARVPSSARGDPALQRVRHRRRVHRQR